VIPVSSFRFSWAGRFDGQTFLWKNLEQKNRRAPCHERIKIYRWFLWARAEKRGHAIPDKMFILRPGQAVFSCALCRRRRRRRRRRQRRRRRRAAPRFVSTAFYLCFLLLCFITSRRFPGACGPRVKKRTESADPDGPVKRFGPVVNRRASIVRERPDRHETFPSRFG